jgi:hypothetical protein
LNHTAQSTVLGHGKAASNSFVRLWMTKKQEQQTFCRICALSVRKKENALFAAI